MSEEPDVVIASATDNGIATKRNVCDAQADKSLSKYTLLIAEDEPDLRNYLSSVLQADFKQVYVAEDGEKAWELLGQYQPDLVVSDVMMPRMDGYELCHRIKTM